LVRPNSRSVVVDAVEAVEVVREVAEAALEAAGVLDRVAAAGDSAVVVAAVRDHRWGVRRRSVIRVAVARLRDRPRRARAPARERDHDRALVAEMSAWEIVRTSERVPESDRALRRCRAISRASVPVRGLELDKALRIDPEQDRASLIDQVWPSNRRGCRDSVVLLEPVLARGCRIREPIGRSRLKVGAAI
jgi:hypothetical protein